MPELRWGATTNAGMVRSENEDTFVAEPMVFAVADGMGGHQAGEVASALAASIIRDRLAAGSLSEDYAVGVVNEVNAAIHGAARADSTKSGMGTTLTAIAVLNAQGNTPEQLVLLNVGDSRTYRFRSGRLQRVTVDHSYVQELVATGHITIEEARTHPRRNIVTRALGIEPNVRTDMWTLPIVRGDRFVLCSDGLVDEVPDDEILELVSTVADPQQLSQQLVDLANNHGGRDNVTVVVLDVLSGIDPPDPTGEIPVDPNWAAGDLNAPIWPENQAGPPDAPSADGVITGAEASTMGEITQRDPSAMPTMPPPAAPLPNRPPDLAPPPDGFTVVGAGQTTAPTLPPRSAAANGSTTADPMPAPTMAAAAASSATASADDDMPPPKTSNPKPRKKRLTVGLFLFVVALAAILVVSITFITVHARSGYFAGFDDEGTVVIYKGQPDGLLWFDPTVHEVTTFQRDELSSAAIEQIEQHVVYDSVDDAITNLQLIAPPETTTTAAATTTTVAETTTTASTAPGETTTTVSSGP